MVVRLTPFDTNWKKGSGATPLTTQDLFCRDAVSIPTVPTKSPVEPVAFASREPQIGAQKALVLAPSWPQISARICRAITS
jgi:hypothetical protein